ncbi:phosphodiester glycosidase family protein [Ruegeria profundi]|uniref:phosphodiester glycosidase family protein n=1 Tax=Ruegeria profundi TaxID=1685378 RepID=UPI003C7E39F0
MIRALATLGAVLWAAQAHAVTCEKLTHEDKRYTVCEVDASEDLRLFLNDAEGDLLGHFSSVNDTLAPEGKRLVFAMNAGMYHDDRSPVGHYVENGQEKMRVIPNAGPGNFGLLPNGVFCIREGRADVFETLTFVDQAPQCRFATQSGPMLVIDGELHPRFLPDSTSRYIRNGVGTSADGTRTVFAISDDYVTFHEFGRLFRDVLETPNALFLDGNISRMYERASNRSDIGFSLGPIVGVVEDAP